MEFSKLCDVYLEIAGTAKRLEKTAILADLLATTPDGLMHDVVLLLRGRLFPEWDKRTLGVSQKLVIRAIVLSTGRPEREVIDAFKRTGDLGMAAAELSGRKRQETLFSQELSVEEVVRVLRRLPDIEGHGSVGLKVRLIAQLLGHAKGDEARFLVRIVLEDLRIGIAEGTLRDAIVWWSARYHESLEYDPGRNAWAGAENAHEILARWHEAVQDAIDRSNDVARVALTARERGLSGLQEIELTLGVPTKVMLAQRALSQEDAFARVGRPCAVEFKYDGFRLIVHRFEDKVMLFTRRLEEVTAQFPDVVEAIVESIKDTCILDCEAVGYDKGSGRHVAFQEVSQRIRRKYEIERLAAELPVEVNVFDILMHGKEMVYKRPFCERRELIERIVPQRPLRLRPSEMLITQDAQRVGEFYKQALDQGYEGLMFKALGAPYKPGSRVGFMVKLKPALDTLDLVITGAEWGEGKRSGWLTSFTLACQDEEGGLVEIGRVGTGFKELEQEGGVTFEEMTSLLAPHVVQEVGKIVSLRPLVVLEVKFEEIQKSPSYSSGYALRFPRVVRVRVDRRAEDISTLADVEDLYRAQRGRG